jgi:hypothetical protein
VVCSCAADFLMVSENSDATGRWKGVTLTKSTGDLTMFPGWDRNGVYVSEYQPRLAAQEIALPAAARMRTICSSGLRWTRAGWRLHRVGIAATGSSKDR